MFIDFRERRRKRERETSISCLPYVPWAGRGLGLNPQPFGVEDDILTETYDQGVRNFDSRVLS